MLQPFTIHNIMLASLPLDQNLDFCIRLVLSCVCGAAIGVERSRHFKEAGVRTHVIVCMGAALSMIVSKYGFADLLGPDGMYFPGVKETDPARVAAQVICGIGFLGAGVIFKREGLVRGLTTAAGIWITAAIGLAVGSGMMMAGFFTAIIVCVLQALMNAGIPINTINQGAGKLNLLVGVPEERYEQAIRAVYAAID